MEQLIESQGHQKNGNRKVEPGLLLAAGRREMMHHLCQAPPGG